jgi:hypothetical protein
VKELSGRRRAVQGPPDVLYDVYQSGITCQVRGHLTLYWNDGRTQQSEIVGVANGGPRDKDAPPYLGDEISSLTQCALRQLARDWLRQNSVQPETP